MSPTKTPNRPGHQRFPRVSGDEPGSGTLLKSAEPFSPRERG